MDYVFEDFNANGLVDEDGKKIEDVATNMVKLFGDYGLFQVWYVKSRLIGPNAK